jgi:hypothetical protein
MIATAAEFFTFLFSGIAGTAFLILLVTLALAWLVFPFLMVSKFNELLKVQRKMLKELEDQTIWAARADGHLQAGNRVREEPEKESLLR